MFKVAYLGSRNVAIPPVRGGAIEHWIVNVSRRLQGCEVLIVSPADPLLPMAESEGHVRYERIQENRLYLKLAESLHWDPYSYLQRAAKGIATFDPDIVHLFNVPLGLDIIRKHCPSAKLILHCMNSYDQIGKRSRPKKGATLKVDLFIGCSNFLVETERQRLAKDAARVKVISNAADTDLYQPWWQHPDRAELRQKLQLTDKKVVLYSGRLTAKKGIDKLVQAMPLLRKVLPEAVLCILGAKGFGLNGSRPDDFVRQLEKDCQHLGEAVQFLGFIKPTEIHNYYAIADVFCQPARWDEPFSISICEAAAAGLPVLATGTGGTPELIADGVSGLLLPPEAEPQFIADQLAAILSDAGTARRLGEAARQRVVEFHNWDTVTRSVEAAYEELLQ